MKEYNLYDKNFIEIFFEKMFQGSDNYGTKKGFTSSDKGDYLKSEHYFGFVMGKLADNEFLIEIDGTYYLKDYKRLLDSNI